MKKIHTLSLLTAAAIAGSNIGKGNKGTKMSTSLVGSKKLSSKIGNKNTIALIVSTNKGLSTVTGSAMKALRKSFLKGKKLSIVGIVSSTSEGMHTTMNKSFKTSKLGKHLKLTLASDSNIITATTGNWGNKKMAKSPFSITKSQKDSNTFSAACSIKLSDGKPTFFKL